MLYWNIAKNGETEKSSQSKVQQTSATKVPEKAWYEWIPFSHLDLGLNSEGLSKSWVKSKNFQKKQLKTFKNLKTYKNI